MHYFILEFLISLFAIGTGDISKYTLDNYLIPVNKPGVTIGRIYPLPSDVCLISDTSSLLE